ncbi:F-BAR domain only protein 1 [Patagioenas fasciata monilis]|uniref:F-BAR domain only protein 1 n=1 Tax=Patagioenas fasciata monilis TaxID=372326 RepID=A0A1V4KQ94_PATFA|nr:F-BAR domain only protein 1 [Patagioenas fasciata monilis]
MSYFTEHFWGEKNHGFDVLYHNMKHGQISTKELADFVRERAAIEENYAKAMVKLSKMATNGTQLGTFAPLWEVFRISSDKLALCHLELMKKLHDLIKEISRYGEEQGRVHKKSKEEVSGTLEAVQLLHGVAQLLPKSKESYHSKCQEYERLRKEGTSQKEIDKAELKSKKAGEALRRAVEKYNAARADFEQRMLDSAARFQEVEEAHLRHMKGLIGSYSHSVEDTHVQIGQVHEEFKQNVENIGTEMLLRRFAESKGTGRERPGALDFDEYRLAPAQEGPKRSRSKAFRIPGLSRKERDRDAVESPDAEVGCPEVDEDGFTVRPDVTRTEAENHVCSSSDSDYDEDEPRKFYVHIKPVQPREAGDSAEATMEQLKATVGNLILPPSIGGTVKRQSSRHVASLTPAPSDTDPEGTLAGGDGARRGHPVTQVNSGPGTAPPDAVPPAALFGPPLESAFEAEDFPDPDLPPRTPCPPQSRSLSPSPSWSCGPSHSAPASLGERGFFAVSQPALGLSRGPSPVVLGSQDTLPVATAFTEYVHAYFKGHDTDSCLVKVTGELTMSFPAGIVRVFSGSAAPPVLSFRLLNAGAIEQFLPNADLLYSDPSQSDPSTKDFWLNMAALTGHLQKQAEQSPAASYYNVALLKYQFSRLGPGAAPLRLCVRWDCSPGATRVSVEYGYNAGAMALPVALANVHVLLPVDEPLTNLRLQPTASWNLEEKRLLWRLLDVPGAPGQGGCGRLSASWEPLCGPSKPSPVAAQFSSEGSTLSGVELELASAGYRMSLVKKRFATGIYLAGS